MQQATQNNIRSPSRSSSPTSSSAQNHSSQNHHQQEEQNNEKPFFAVDQAISLSDPDSLQVMGGTVTPRTRRVFRSLGIQARHLQEPNIHDIVREMKQHHEDRNLVNDDEVVELRFKFRVESQGKLMNQAMRLYQILLAEEEQEEEAEAEAGEEERAVSPHHHHNSKTPIPVSSSSSSSSSSVTAAEMQSPSSAGQQQLNESSSSATRPRSACSASSNNNNNNNNNSAIRSSSRLYTSTSLLRKRKQLPQTSLEDEKTDHEIQEARRNAEHIKHANMKRIEQILMKREIARFKHDSLRETHTKQIAIEKEQEELRKKHERESAQKEVKIQLAREAAYQKQKEERQKEMERLRKEFDARTRELDFRWNARRRRTMQENQHRHELNEIRRAGQLENAEASMARKRQVQEQGQLIAELLLSRRRQDQSEQLHSQLDAASDKARYRLAEVRARGEALQDAKLAKLKEREEHEKKVAEEQNRQRRIEIEEKRKKEELKAERRRNAIIQASRHTTEQRKKVAQGVAAYEQRAEHMKFEREHQQILRKEHVREVELSHSQFKERQQEAMKARRDDLEALVIEKNARVAALAQRRENRRARRLMIRQEAEKTRMPTQEVLPGPGEYDLDRAKTTGSPFDGGPRFSFGIPYSAMGAKQIDKNTPCTNYESSPGPAVYVPSDKAVRRHKKIAILGRSKRWHRTEDERNPTPGPGAYFSPKSEEDIDVNYLETELNMMRNDDAYGTGIDRSVSMIMSRGGEGGGGLQNSNNDLDESRNDDQRQQRNSSSPSKHVTF